MADEADTSLETVNCDACDIEFSVSKRFLNARRKDGRGFYCPVGHPLVFNDAPAKRLEKIMVERDQWEKEAQRLLAECNRLRDEVARLRKKRVRGGWFSRAKASADG
jgi:hypothetical protein